MNKKFLLNLCMVFSILFFSNRSVVHAEGSNGWNEDKINEINAKIGECVATEFGDGYDFVIVSYGESVLCSKLARPVFQPPDCIHMSDIYTWVENPTYVYNSENHTYIIYGTYTYSCGCSGTVKLTNNSPESHQLYYADKGHQGDTHYYDYCCKICPYLKYTRYYDCPGLKTGKHVRP